MRELRRVAGLLVAATGVAGLLLGLRPVPGARIVAGYVLALGAIALTALVRSLRAAAFSASSAFERALAPPVDAPARPPELLRLERELTLGTATASHFHTRLRPGLRHAAAARLAARHHVDLERRPDAARALLGEEAWELLRPDAVPPGDRHAPGVPLRTVRRVVERLESL